jgi:hypothetical protein
MHLKNGKITGNGVYALNGTISRMMVASKLKISDQKAAPVLKIMDPVVHKCL